MTDLKQALERKRDELAESGSQNGPYQPYSSESFHTGFNVALELLWPVIAAAEEEPLRTEGDRAVWRGTHERVMKALEQLKAEVKP